MSKSWKWCCFLFIIKLELTEDPPILEDLVWPKSVEDCFQVLLFALPLIHCTNKAWQDKSKIPGERYSLEKVFESSNIDWCLGNTLTSPCLAHDIVKVVCLLTYKKKCRGCARKQAHLQDNMRYKGRVESINYPKFEDNFFLVVLKSLAPAVQKKKKSL